MKAHIIAVLALVFFAYGTRAATCYVDPDGSGDFPTIQAAVDAATDGDTVLLGDGVFNGDGNRNIDFLGKAITMRSRTGSPTDCVIDCHWYAHTWCRGFVFESGEGSDSILEGVTIRNGVCNDEYSSRYGAGIMCSASPTISNCIIEDCVVGGHGGGIACSGEGCSPTITGCVFRHNRSEETAVTSAYGGGIFCANGATPVFTDCVIRGNRSETWAGGIFTYYADPVFIGCLIAENTCILGYEAAIRAGTSALFRNCTIVAHWDMHPCITIGVGADIKFDNTIIAFNTVAFGDWLLPGTVTLSCCDVYGNEQGDWVYELAGQAGLRGNICADPLFCDVSLLDFHVEDGSPCAPYSAPNPSCDLIGAFGVGCSSSSAVEAMSWGAIKALYGE